MLGVPARTERFKDWVDIAAGLDAIMLPPDPRWAGAASRPAGLAEYFRDLIAERRARPRATT